MDEGEATDNSWPRQIAIGPSPLAPPPGDWEVLPGAASMPCTDPGSSESGTRADLCLSPEVVMIALSTLWLPILLSAVAVFVVSSVIHMASPWHKDDYPAVPDQDKVMAALRPFAIPPGDYMLPRPASMDEMKSAAFADKMTQGPVMILTVMPNGPTDMKRNLGLWFVFAVVVGFISAYVAGRALPVGAAYLHVFRFVGTTAFVAYAAALWPISIWYRRAWSTTIKGTVDGLIYASLTAGVFGWLWPR